MQGFISAILVCCAFSAAFAAPSAPSLASATPIEKQALVLVSVAFGGPGIDQYVAGLVSGLKKGGMDSSDIAVEYLDLPRTAGSLRASLGTLLVQKYAKRHFDLVFCVQQPALDFLLKEGGALAPRATVLSAYAMPPPMLEADRRQFVFQTARLDYAGTLQRALELFPATKNLIVIQGNSELERARQDNIRTDLAPWQGKLHIEDTQALSFAQIDAKLANASKDTIIMGVGILQDAAGEVFLPAESYARIAKVANAPAFVLYDTTVGSGFVGGMVTRIGHDASQLSAMGLDIARGQTRLNAAITSTPGSSTPLFDWKQIERWGGNAEALPEGTVFINQPQTLWRDHKNEILVVIAVVCVLGAFLFAVLRMNRRMRLALDTLQVSQQNLAITLDSIGDAVITTDTAGRITGMNPTAERLTAWSRDASLGQPLTDVFRIINAQTRLLSDNPVQSVLRLGKVVGRANHTALVARDGREYQIADSAAPIRDAAGDIVGVVLVFSDVTERYRMERSLHESEKRYRSLMDTIACGVVAHAPDTSIQFFNPMATHLLGVTDVQILGKTATDLAWRFLQDDASPMPLENYPVNRVLATGEALHNYVVGIRHRDRAEPTWVLCSAYPVCDDQGVLFQVVVTFTDITQSKHAEQALRRLTTMLERTENMARLASFEWEVESNTVTWSPEMFRLFGRDPHYGTPNLEGQAGLYTPESAQVLYAAVDRALMDATPYTLELMLVRANGEQHPCIVKGFPERDASGRVVRIAGLVQDITQRKRDEIALLESQNRLQTVVDSTREAIGVYRAGKVVFVNPAAMEMLGAHSKEELLGKTALDFVHPDFRAIALERMKRIAREGLPLPVLEEKFCRLDRTPIDVEVQSTPIIYEGEKAVQVAMRDITAHKQAQAQLRLAASVFKHAREGIAITNAEGNYVEVNESFTRITGYSREDAIGQNPRILNSGRQDKEFYAVMWRDLAEQGHWSGEIWNRHKNGEVFAELLTISAVRDVQGRTQHYVALFSDITAIKEHQSKLDRMAHFDALTNLPNRLLLADRLQQGLAQAMRRGNTVAVAYLDLDGFKAINDHHGHDVGDLLLCALASRMKQTLREGDTLARLGGDEFVAVLSDLPDAQASAPLLTRLLAAAAQSVAVGKLEVHVSASLGVTFYPQAHDIDAEQLLRQADQAMYQAKLSGKNRYHVFDAAHDSSIRGHHESMERIRQALENREFVLHYQPKVNMRSGQVVGVEALIRWQHPEKGLLAPGLFLPAVENDVLAVSIGEWVIDTALTQIARWQASGLELGVSVNVGARQLQQANFVARLQGILATHPDVPANRLAVEVLETSALEDISQVSQVIEACAALGMVFALDDFGTGYSSLTYLKRLRVGLLKIDQSFVRDMLDDPDDLAILQGVIGLAGAFGCEVIAEGVETAAHGSVLLHLGCELAQGYGIARPMPGDQIPAWVTRWELDADWGNTDTSA